MDAFIENNKVPQSSLPCLGGDTCDVIKSNKNIFSAFGPILVAKLRFCQFLPVSGKNPLGFCRV